MKTSILFAALAAALASAHDVAPKTPDELKAYERARDAMYECAPVIAAMTKQRKRSWQQKLIGGLAGIGGAMGVNEDLFNSGAFATVEEARVQGKKLLECGEVGAATMKNNTCVLSPIVTQGPYYHISGHPIRQNMAEWQLGIPFMMDIGVIDVETCEPIEGALVDIWHANATGHYAGHPDPAPELINEEPAASGPRKGLLSAFPRSNFHDEWLRAAWPTNKNGVAQFSSIFPGYYTGRATHVHAKVHLNWSVNPNGTFYSDVIQYIGQFFVDDEINVSVDKMWPYNTNPIANLPGRGRTRNWIDSLNIFQDSHGNGFNPTFDIEKIGAVMQQGMIGYITVGINRTEHLDHKWRGMDVMKGLKEKQKE